MTKKTMQFLKELADPMHEAKTAIQYNDIVDKAKDCLHEELREQIKSDLEYVLFKYPQVGKKQVLEILKGRTPRTSFINIMSAARSTFEENLDRIDEIIDIVKEELEITDEDLKETKENENE